MGKEVLYPHIPKSREVIVLAGEHPYSSKQVIAAMDALKTALWLGRRRETASGTEYEVYDTLAQKLQDAGSSALSEKVRNIGAQETKVGNALNELATEIRRTYNIR